MIYSKNLLFVFFLSFVLLKIQPICSYIDFFDTDYPKTDSSETDYSEPEINYHVPYSLLHYYYLASSSSESEENTFTLSKKQILDTVQDLCSLREKNFTVFATLVCICRKRVFWDIIERINFLTEDKILSNITVYIVVRLFCKKNMFKMYIDQNKVNRFLNNYNGEFITFELDEDGLLAF